MIQVKQPMFMEEGALVPRCFPGWPETWGVERRFSEFVALEKKFKEYYPGIHYRLVPVLVSMLEMAANLRKV